MNPLRNIQSLSETVFLSIFSLITEMRSMSLFEFDAEEHEKAIKQIAYEDGYDKGEEAGAIRGRVELILSMFNSGKTPEQISDFCGLDLKEVEKIIEQSDGNSLDN